MSSLRGNFREVNWPMVKFKQIKSAFQQHINLYKSLYKDKRTPKISKILLWAAIGYFFLPFDLIPDFIPVLGHVDDAIIIPSLLYLAVKLIPEKLYQEHYKKIFKKQTKPN